MNLSWICCAIAVIGFAEGGHPAFGGEIHDAARDFNWGRVRVLLKTNPDLVNSKDEYGMTPLHWSAKIGDDLTAKLLLDNKADSEARDNDGWTPLHHAASEGRFAVTRVLLDGKADVNAKTPLGATPLDLARLAEQRHGKRKGKEGEAVILLRDRGGRDGVGGESAKIEFAKMVAKSKVMAESKTKTTNAAKAAEAKTRTRQIQIRLESAASSQMNNQKQRGPVAETFRRYYAASGIAHLVSVDAPGGGQWLAPEWHSVPEYISVRKRASSFRIGTQDKIAFILTTDKKDDAEEIKCFRFDNGKHGREYETGKWTACVGGGGSFVRMSCRDFVPNQGLAINVEKLTESSYRITPLSPIDSGEYGLTSGDMVFTFGVGAPAK